jgi:hypothetical protein
MGGIGADDDGDDGDKKAAPSGLSALQAKLKKKKPSFM